MDAIRHSGGGPVTADARACLKAGGALSPCDRCVEACPTAALSWQGLDPITNGDCLGCGRCAAACPNDALEVAGFAVRNLPRGSELPIACRRDRDAVRDGAAILPCLGGLTAMLVLEFCDASDRAVVLLDRGWCMACPAGGDAAPWGAALAEAGELLSLAGWPNAKMPRVEARPLAPMRAAAIVKPDFDGTRRSLFTMPLAAPSAEIPPRGRVSARRRRVEQTWLARLAARMNGGAVVEALPQITIGALCHDHGICAALCPTGALERWHGDTERGLAFDAMKCLGCGRCAEACPTGAMLFLPRGGRSGGRVPVSRHASRTCDRCSTTFAAQGGDNLCPACARRHALAQSAFSSVNQARG